MTSSESEWAFDYILQLLKSPDWEVPMTSFIDEHCAIFDLEDENKFEYTAVHADFRDLVETLLTSHLEELGMDMASFQTLCEQQPGEKGQEEKQDTRSSEQVLTQILALDDFLTFKTMMVRRNMELEVEVIENLKAQCKDGSDVRFFVDSYETKDEAEEAFQRELEAAIALTQEQLAEGDVKEKKDDYDDDDDDDGSEAGESKQSEAKEELDSEAKSSQITMSSEEQECQAKDEQECQAKEAHLVAMVDQTDDEEEEEGQQGLQRDLALKQDMDTYLLEMELLYRQQEFEQAELETALAMSLAIEDAQVRTHMLDQEKTLKPKKRKTSIEEMQHRIDLQARAVKAQRLRQAQVQTQVMELSPEEVDRRSKHLRHQRDLLLQKKKDKREATLKRHQEEKKRLGKTATKAEQEKEETKDSDSSSSDQTEERRTALRVALARRMKQELITGSSCSSTGFLSSEHESSHDVVRRMGILVCLERVSTDA